MLYPVCSNIAPPGPAAAGPPWHSRPPSLSARLPLAAPPWIITVPPLPPFWPDAEYEPWPARTERQPPVCPFRGFSSINVQTAIARVSSPNLKRYIPSFHP